MGFVWASIGGKLYGAPGSNADEVHRNLDVPETTPHTIAFDENLRQIIKRKPGSLPVVGASLFHQLSRTNSFARMATLTCSVLCKKELKAQESVDSFMVGLAVCNTVVPTVDSEGELQYQVGLQTSHPDIRLITPFNYRNNVND